MCVCKYIIRVGLVSVVDVHEKRSIMNFKTHSGDLNFTRRFGLIKTI